MNPYRKLAKRQVDLGLGRNYLGVMKRPIPASKVWNANTERGGIRPHKYRPYGDGFFQR
jgi:hypothetical protein